MIRWHPLFRRHVAENPPLLLVVSAHITETLFVSWGLPDCLVFQQAPSRDFSKRLTLLRISKPRHYPTNSAREGLGFMSATCCRNAIVGKVPPKDRFL